MKTINLKIAGSAIAGFVFAGIVFVISHQLIYPALCAADGTLWAAWVQAAAIIVTGLAATYAAFYQLNRFNNNERFKTTLEMLNNYERATFSVASGQMPLPEGAALVLRLLEPDTFDWFAAASRKYMKKRLSDVDSPEARDYYRYSNAAIAIANHFSKVGALARRGTLDSTLYLSMLSDIVQNCYIACEKISTVESWSWTFGEFQYLRDAAVKWDREAQRG